MEIRIMGNKDKMENSFSDLEGKKNKYEEKYNLKEKKMIKINKSIKSGYLLEY